MNIREATVRDIPEMHRIRMSVRENALSDPRSVQPHHYEPMLNVQGRGWVAEADGRIVGFAVADTTAASVWALFVDPDWEGRGVGRSLHDRMIAWLFAAGFDVLHLTTTPETRAEKFYIAAGWTFVGSHTDGEVRYRLTREPR